MFCSSVSSCLRNPATTHISTSVTARNDISGSDAFSPNESGNSNTYKINQTITSSSKIIYCNPIHILHKYLFLYYIYLFTKCNKISK